MFSDHFIRIAGRSIAITGHDVFTAGVSVAIGLIFWAAFYFSRKRIVVLQRSRGTDQVAFELARIADALERIANRPADRAIASAMRRQVQAQPPLQRESQGVAYSMFGANEPMRRFSRTGSPAADPCERESRVEYRAL